MLRQSSTVLVALAALGSFALVITVTGCGKPTQRPACGNWPERADRGPDEPKPAEDIVE